MKSNSYIKKNQEFRKIYRTGSSVADRLLVVYKTYNKTGLNRFGYSVSKKIGNAVIRNRVKRKLREICRLNKDNMIQGFDLVIIARNPIKSETYHIIEKSVLKLFNKLRMFKEENK